MNERDQFRPRQPGGALKRRPHKGDAAISRSNLPVPWRAPN
ncbi:MAG TPA: hypothetical protein VL752_03235 [Acidisoma sp.]|nr:hypothetical protein [Acidisoma sp.]HTH99938.1 hypothetical protein [Acidisoma sp.]